MEVAGSLVELGVSFAPVPGLVPAFNILKFIWDSVQKASFNKKALRNLAVSTADIFKAVNQVLSPGLLNEHIQSHLRNFEKVLSEIRDFAEDHVASNLFKILIKNVDIEERIEYFQSRLQHLSWAFNIASYGDIKADVHKLLKEQHTMSQRLHSPFFSAARPSSSEKSTNKKKQVHDYDEVHADVTFSEPCRIDIRKSRPVLACVYFADDDLSHWGMGNPESKVKKAANGDGFDITWPGSPKTFTWSVAWKVITASMRDVGYPEWKDAVDISFSSADLAGTWLSWLESYASLKWEGSKHSRPHACDVNVRKKADYLLRKKPNRIERRIFNSSNWWVTVDGKSQSFGNYRTHFTYTSNGTLPFVTLYRSGDTLVIERCDRAYDEEPTASRRYQFDTEEEAQIWYDVWKDCAKSSTGGNGPIQVHVTSEEPGTVQLRNRIPVLDNPLFPELNFNNWGLKKPNSSLTHFESGFEVVTTSSSWAWRHSGSRILVYMVLASHPDWRDSLEIVFRSAEASDVWFKYFTAYCTTGLPSSLPPRAEHVTTSKTRICWMQMTENSIQRRTMVSDRWTPIFGKYKSIKIHSSHLTLIGTSILPHMRIFRDREVLTMESRGAPNDPDVSVLRRYQFGSEAEAKAWYDVWKAHLKQAISPQENE